MRKITLVVLALGLSLAANVAESSAFSSTQDRKKPDGPAINLESLLTDAGYKPIKVRDGMWGVSSLAYQGKNLKKLDMFLEVNQQNGLLRITARIGFHEQPAENVELKKALDGLAERLKPTEFPLSKGSLFAEIEVPADNLDRILIVQAIERAAGEADRAYPDVAKFIKRLPGPESTGAGAGMGMGTGRGGGIGQGDPDNAGPNRSNPVSAKPVEVDTKPAILYKPTPVYTDEARKNQVQGSVVLRIVIDETGAATKIRVVRGLPDGLSEQAIEVARKMKFRPAMKDGKPVEFAMVLEVNFFLQ